MLVAPLWAVAAMLSIQLGAGLSAPLLSAIGPSGTTWLRLTWAAVLLVLIARPRLRGQPRKDVLAAVALGVTTAGLTLFYFEAIARIPMGIATTIEFLGPLGVAIALSRRRLDALWAMLAAAGVLLLVSEEGFALSGEVLGYAFAAAAGACWAGYILLTKRVGAAFERMDGLAISLITAAVVSAPLGLMQAAPRLELWHVLAVAGLAVLVPLLPYVLELMALRRLHASTFGVLMSLEPAVSALVGLVILHQHLTPPQWLGIACAVVASIGASTATRPAGEV